MLKNIFFNKQKDNLHDEIISFIDDYKKFLLCDEIFKEKSTVEYFFSMGGCFIFAKILKLNFNETEISINKERCHSGIIYKKYFYDIYCEHLIRKRNFKVASGKDIEYMSKSFGFKKYDLDNFEETFINRTSDCFNNKEKTGLTLNIEVDGNILY